MKSMLEEERDEFKRRTEIVARIHDQKRAYELATADINRALGAGRQGRAIGLIALLVAIIALVLATGCSRRETPAQTVTSASNEAAKQEARDAEAVKRAWAYLRERDAADKAKEQETWNSASTKTTTDRSLPGHASAMDSSASSSRSTVTSATFSATMSSSGSRSTTADGMPTTAGLLAVTRTEGATTPAVERCVEQVKGRPIPPPCIPPQTHWNPNAKPPFDVMRRYGYVGKIAGQATFVWLKASESSRPCTAAERANGAAYKLGCSAKIGDPLVELPQFRELPRPEIAAESMAVGTALPAIRRVDDLDMFATMRGDRYCRVGTNLAACAGRRRYFLVAIQVADMLRGPDKESTRDDIVLDFGRMACGLNADGSVASVCRWMSYRPTEDYAINSWTVAPVENDSKGDQHVQFAVNGGRLLTPVMRIRDLQPISAGDLK